MRFQIQDIEIQLDDESDKKHSSKEALLLWCQRKTHGYPHVEVVDFTRSWRNGMAFNALIHSHRPELIDYKALDPNDPLHNLNNAFEVAQSQLGIQPLLDPEDVDVPKPDEKSILTYVSSFYHTFAKYNSELISGKRITNIISQLMEIDRFQTNYETFTTDLLNWIRMKIYELNNRDFPNSLEGIHNEFIKFKEYRTVEKAPKYKERSEIEALLFDIQTKRKALGQSVYVPPEGKLVQDIQKDWAALEKAEHKRELELRKQMIQLEKFDNVAASYHRKSGIYKNYLKDMIQVLSDGRYGSKLAQVDATVKKHEAICEDVKHRSERKAALAQMLNELDEGNYHGIDELKAIDAEIQKLNDQLQRSLEHHQASLSTALNFMNSKREIETVTSELVELINRINIDPNVTHLRAVEEYLDKHSLIEAQIPSHGDTVKRLKNTANKLTSNPRVQKSSLLEKQIPQLQESANLLVQSYEQLANIANNKRVKLIKLQDFYKLMQDIDEEDAALSEKLNICQAILPGKDLRAIISLQQKHNVFEAEVKAHNCRLNKITKRCQTFVENDHPQKQLIESKLNDLNRKWKQLQEMVAQKSKELSDATEAFQYHADANEAQSWLKEKTQLAKSEDCGSDEQSATSLLKRHSGLENEVTAYKHDIDRLNGQCERMINSGVENLFLLSQDPFLTSTANESIEEIAEEPKEVFKEVFEDRLTPQIVMLYDYKGNDYPAKKGEVLLLLHKSNKDWWNVQREDETRSGYVPANHVKEIEPKLIRYVTKKPVKAGEQPASKRSENKSKYKRKNKNRRLSIVCDTETVEQRKNQINSDYLELVALCELRRAQLEDSIRMFRFNHEAKSFETWMDQMKDSMTNANNEYNEQKQQQGANPVSELSKQFEQFITDLLANRTRLDSINKMASEIQTKQNAAVAKKKQDQIAKKWDNLNFQQKQLGKNIEGLTTIEAFNSACDETVERINEKLDKINNTQGIGEDLKTVQELQRRHENIERELVPINDSLKRIQILSDNVSSSAQKQHVKNRLDELNRLWDELKDSSNKKRNYLDKMVGLQILKNSANDILMWITNYAKPLMKFDKQDASLKNLENLDTISKEHNDLWIDIQGKKNDIADLQAFREKLSTQVPKEELAVIDQLVEEYEQMCQEWQDKTDYLKECKNLITFNQEADRIDTIINSDLAFLEIDNLGNNINDVLSLIKQHETFNSKLLAKDQRVHNLADFGEKLIQNKHYDSKQIEERRKAVIDHCKTLKNKAYERRKQLDDAKVYHEIKRDGGEFTDWCDAKAKLIEENDSKSGATNMEGKLKKHQAFTAEIHANKSQLDKIVKNIDDVNKNAHYASKELEETKEQVLAKWDNLIGLIEDKDKMLEQLLRQKDYVKSLNVIDERVDELTNIINSPDYGIDRRSCKNLIQQNKSVENELNSLNAKLNELMNKDEVDGASLPVEVAEHIDSDVIQENYGKLRQALDALNAPLEERKQKLEKSYHFYEFEFDVNVELQWIKEHLIMAASNDAPQNLTEAQNMIKKFEQNLIREVEGHENHVQKLIDSGNELIEENHFASDSIKEKIGELESEWAKLKDLMDKRYSTLKTCLSIQQFLYDCAEIETWMGEKMNFLSSAIFGNDEITVVKLLQKQKAIDLEIDFNLTLATELSRKVDNLNKELENEADRKMLNERLKDVNSQLKRLQKISNQRTLSLMELKKMHEFSRECNDFLSWIAAQKQILATEDYGKDFEHCTLLQAKFTDLKRSILSNEDRYKQCIEFGNSLANNDDDTRFTINKNIEFCANAWEELIEMLNKKEQKFIGASKIHRFNRDVADAYERIKEKFTILNSQDLGRDTHSTKNLIRKHEVFENDLVALEAQLQILINDSVKLKAAYSGANAERISNQIASVVESWNKLKEATAIRNQKLLDTYDYYRFVSMVRNLEQWCVNLKAEIETEDNTQDVQSAQKMRLNHDRIKSEIDSREEEFGALVAEANNLTHNGYYPDIKALTERLLAIRDDLYNSWERKNVYLHKLYDRNCFLRDAKQLEQLCQQHHNRLSSADTGETVEEVTQNLKKHDEFVKIFDSLEFRFNDIADSGGNLIQKQHDESAMIEERLNELLNKRAKLRRLVAERREELADALILVQLKRDVIETELWIDEKSSQIEKEQHSIQDNDNVELKMQKLQKLQTIEAEINANSSRIDDIQEKAKHLMAKNNPSSIEIRTQQDNLLQKWNDLLALLRDISQGFEEAKDIYEFNKNIGQIESWIREKELMIQFNDTGEDYEHCASLMRKLDDVDTDMKVDENRIQQINDLGNKLNNQNKKDLFNEEQVNKQRVALNENWQKLQQKIGDYRNRLACVSEIHLLDRDLDDINQRIQEKQALVSKDCEAKNLSAVEREQRKHEAILVDIMAIENQFKAINDNECRRLFSKYPELTEKPRAKAQTIQENLRKVNKDWKVKENRLDFFISLHKFYSMVKDVEKWAQDMLKKQLSRDSESHNVAEAKHELQNHESLKAEILARREDHQQLKNYALPLLKQIEHDQVDSEETKEQIENCIQKIDDSRKKLDQVWEEKNVYLKQCLDLQIFNDLSKKCDSWLATKEAFLNNDDLGSNLASVEDLLKKHDSFVKSLSAQQRVTDLVNFAEALISRKHFQSEMIQIKLNETLERKERLLEMCKTHRDKLNDSKAYFQFMRNLNEIRRWLNEKIKVATDDSYRELINLLSKIQRHEAFKAEIAANMDRVNAVIQEGENLVNSNHFKSEEIKTQLASIEKLVRNLNESVIVKRDLLDDAYKVRQFFRLCDEIELWSKDVESIFNDTDYGKDLTSVRNILKKHQITENDVHNHNEAIEQVKDHLADFEQRNHFLLDEIQQSAKHIIQCFDGLQKPMNKKRELLEERFAFFSYKRDVEDELNWLKEKENQLTQFDNGNTLHDVDRLLKKLKIFESELQTRELHLSSLVAKGHNLIKASNNNSEDIKQLTHEIQNKIKHLKDELTLRRFRLMESRESFQFYMDVDEAESWLNEKKSFLMSDDIGTDEESVLSLMKKLDVLRNDMNQFFATTMNKLIQQANILLEKNHFDSQMIKKRNDDLLKYFNSFDVTISEKKSLLEKRLQFFRFERDADELILWIKDQLIIANSGDHGQDVHHVDKLLQQFNNFVTNINANEERITAIEKQGKEVEGSQDKLAKITELWIELKNAIQARENDLEGAKKLHTFAKSVDETLCWIREKDSSTVLDDVDINPDDLYAIQAKIREFETFDRDLGAVREQVEGLYLEADRVALLFPDFKETTDEQKIRVQEAWAKLMEKTNNQKEFLHQIEKSQSYFDDYQELISWINKMRALITADSKLGADVISAEDQLSRHKEYKAEIDTRNDNIAAFLQNGENIIAQDHFMAPRIQGTNKDVKSLYKNLIDTWNKRLTLYEYNLDARQYLQETEQVEKWINSHYPILDDNNLGDSISEVEELLAKHEEFEKTVSAQRPKLGSIERITQIEDYFKKLQEKERQARELENSRQEKERIENRIREEQLKILHQRKKEEPNYYENAPYQSGRLTPTAAQRKPPSRISSFSFSRKPKKVKPADLVPETPPVSFEGFLERKHMFTAGEKKAPFRSWKTHYTVLCGQLLCFFKDKNAFQANNSSAPPFSIFEARCRKTPEYKKKKYSFSIQLKDMSKFMFAANDKSTMEEWVNAITYRTTLPPAYQLLEQGLKPKELPSLQPHEKEEPIEDLHSSSSSLKSSLSSPTQGFQEPQYDNLPPNSAAFEDREENAHANGNGMTESNASINSMPKLETKQFDCKFSL